MPGFPFPRRFFSFSVPKTNRYVAGIHLDLETASLQGAILQIADVSDESAPALAAFQSRELPRELTTICHQWIEIQCSSNTPNADEERRAIAALPIFRAQSADAAIELIESLLHEANLTSRDVLLVGVLDPGLWLAGRNGTYVPCLDSAAIANKTGICLCDGFVQSDLAAGGLGGPIEAGPLWKLLASPEKNRLVFDLQSTALRLFWLPPESRGGLRKLLAFDAAPGMELLNQLVRRISYDKMSSDPTGKMAVQGKKIPELLERWKSNSFFQTPLPRFSPQGIKSNPFILEAMNLAVESNWRLHDVLCTAVHFQADCLANAVQKYLTGKVEQVYVMGPGGSNGLLCRELNQRIPHVETLLTSETVIPANAAFASCAAVLADWFVRRTPGDFPQVTGCRQPVVLGRLISGSADSFARLSEALVQSTDALLKQNDYRRVS